MTCVNSEETWPVTTNSTWDQKPLAIDGLRIKDGKVQIHYCGGKKWYTQENTEPRIITIAAVVK